MHYKFSICLGRAAGKTFFLSFCFPRVPLPHALLNQNSFPDLFFLLLIASLGVDTKAWH
jgi:hypothetical protein